MTQPVTHEVEVLGDLHYVRGLIKQGWVQNGYAKDRENNFVGPLSPIATKWCIDSATRKTKHDDTVYKLLQGTLRRFGLHPSVIRYNDDPNITKQDMLNLIDMTIEDYSVRIENNE